MFSLFPAQAADLPEIDALLDAGFGPARRNRTAYRLRDGAAPDAMLSLVVRDGARLVGSLQCWPVQLRGVKGDVSPLTLLGPVVVAADAQGQGIATAMMRAALSTADALAMPPMLLIGDAPFYGRFGFVAAPTAGWQMPGPVARDRVLLRGDARELPVTAVVEPIIARRAA